MSDLFELEIVPNEGSTDAVEETACICFHCQHFFVETDSEGWEYPSYQVPCCNCIGEEGKFIHDECYIDGWPIEECDSFEEKE